MRVRTPDGTVHDLPAPDAVELMHTSDAVPVTETEKVETRPSAATRDGKRAEKR